MAEVSDAERMNKYADASLLVIRQNRAHTAVINKMVSVLDNGDAKLLGCVLNNTYVSALNSSTGMAYGGYGKYGKYGNYGNYHTKTKTRN
jgi:Mrp family chromosome partitioning ATPase